jgi:hypothetical protein
MRTERGDEPTHVGMAVETAETLHGFEDAGGDPAEHHLTTTPSLDVAVHMTRPTDHTLSGIRGGQRTL